MTSQELQMSILKKNSLIKDKIIDEKVFKTDDVTAISNSKDLFNVPCVQIKNTLYTPLQASLIYQSSKIRDFLLKQKSIDINTKNSKGENALVTAISSKAPSSVIKELFNKNIEISIPKDSSKASILEYADPSWEGYSELSHMIQRKKSHISDIRRTESKKQTVLKEDEAIDVNVAHKYKLIKGKTIDEQITKPETSIRIEENDDLSQEKGMEDTSSNGSPVTLDIDERFRDIPETPSKQESIRESLNPTEREVFNPINDLKHAGILRGDKASEKDGKKDEDNLIISTKNKSNEHISGSHQLDTSVRDINEEGKTTNDFRKLITRVQKSIRSKEYKTKNSEDIKDYSTETYTSSCKNNSEDFNEKSSMLNEKSHTKKDTITVKKGIRDEEARKDTDDEYLLLIDHQITESIEMSREFFTCSFCAGFRPWKSTNE